MPKETIVHAAGVEKSFGDHQVLRGIDFAVSPGEVSVIIGPSGSGKSTFLRAVNGLETIDRGDLFVSGEQVGYSLNNNRYRRWHDKQWANFRSRIGMVFQRFNLYGHLSALENVELALIHVQKMPKHEAQAKAMEQLRLVGLLDAQTQKLPHKLSGGQQQRVAIARALAMEPELMLFDEPTSALDPELVDEVLETMKLLAAKGMTMLVVTHEIGFAKQVTDTISFFDEGKILLSDTPKNFFNSSHERVNSFLERVR